MAGNIALFTAPQLCPTLNNEHETLRYCLHCPHPTCIKCLLTLNPLMWKIWWAPNNASRGQMGFNSAFKGLTLTVSRKPIFHEQPSRFRLFYRLLTHVSRSWILHALPITSFLIKSPVQYYTECKTYERHHSFSPVSPYFPPRLAQTFSQRSVLWHRKPALFP